MSLLFENTLYFLVRLKFRSFSSLEKGMNITTRFYNGTNSLFVLTVPKSITYYGKIREIWFLTYDASRYQLSLKDG